MHQILEAGFARPALALCLALPWLNGLTAGPSPNFWPLWGSAVLGVAVLLQWRTLDARCVAQAWLAAALLSSVLAMLQYFGLASGLAPWVSTSEVGQSYGNLRQRNHFASLTSIGLVCLLALQAWHSAQWFKPGTMAKEAGVRSLRCFGLTAWPIAAAAWLALGNAASSSRTGFLQWTLILVVLLGAWLVRKGPRTMSQTQAFKGVAALLLWANACYGVFLLLLPRSLSAWQNIDVSSLAERLAGSGQDSRRVLWDNVLHLIAQRPWSGWGWGELDYAHFITLYPGGRFSELLDNAHNLPLHLAVELGVVAATLAGLGLAVSVWRIRPWQERDTGRLLALGVLAVIGVHSLLEFPLWYGPFHWATVFCVLWLWRTRPSALPTHRPSQGLRPPIKAWLLAGMCWLVLAVIAVDYARITQLYLPANERWASFRAQPHAALVKQGGSIFFKHEVDFARLVTTAVTDQNAADMQALALALLHYSPEPRVVESLIASSVLLGQSDTAAFYLVRYRAAFPHEAWRRLLERHPDWAWRLPA